MSTMRQLNLKLYRWKERRERRLAKRIYAQLFNHNLMRKQVDAKCAIDEIVKVIRGKERNPDDRAQ